MRALAVALPALLLVLAPGFARALDYLSVGEAAVLYDAPSQKARPLFAIAAGTPVEAIVALDTWIKVRDMQGDLAWIERRLLTDRRMVQTRGEGAQVRAAANENAALVFEAKADVLLELLEAAPAGWIKVRHRDGQQGFVKVMQVWGY
ncbi:MAG: SH3 domain-containing protein [Pseudomonadota bacterium]